MNEPNPIRVVQSITALVLLGLSTACIVEPANDYYDRDHHRYYHEHAWHDCAEHDAYCR